MVCIYNPSPEQLSALDKYAHVLGSEEAAYYVLSQNNGFPLDKTPTGEDSDVYQDLLSHYGNEDEAIRMKSTMYTSRFLESNGDWTMGSMNDPSQLDSKGEPLASIITGTTPEDLQDILNNQFLLDPDASTIEDEIANIKPNDNLQNYAVDQLLRMSYDRYVEERTKTFVRENPTATPDDVQQNKIELSRQWYSRKVQRIMTEQVKALAKAFGFIYVQKPNGSIELQTRGRNAVTGVKELRLKFLNSIVNDPLEDQLRAQITGRSALGVENTAKVEGAPEYMHDAIVRHIQNDRMLAASTLINVGLNNGTSTTINRSLAYHYITMFLDSPMIDAGLKAVDDGKGRSTLYLVNKLVEVITTPSIAGVKNSSIVEKVFQSGIKQEMFDDFWDNFDELLDQVINKGVKSEQAKQKILSVIAAAFQLNDTYNIYTKAPIYLPNGYFDSYADWYATKYKPWGEQNDEQITEIQGFFDTLQTYYENKIKRQERDSYVNKQSAQRTEEALYKLQQYDTQNPVDLDKAIDDVLNTAYLEIVDADKTISNLFTDGRGIIEIVANLGSEYNNVIGFYNYIINEQLEPFFPASGGQFQSKTLLYQAVKTLLSHLNAKYKSKLLLATEQYVDHYVDRYMDRNVVTEEQIRNAKANLHLELKNDAIYGDLKNYELWLIMNSVSTSSLVRQVADSLMRLNVSRDQMVRDAGMALQTQLNKAKMALMKNPIKHAGYVLSPRNFQMLFQERLSDGTPSGMFVRRLYYGEFFKQRREYITQLIKDIEKEIQNATGNIHFRMPLDAYGNPIFLEGPEWDVYRREYEHKLNAFECTYGNKRFVQDYYDMRIDYLSEDTMAAQDDVQKRIDILLQGVTRDGIPYLHELTVAERRKLDELYKEQDDLGNEYTLNGIKKTGNALRMAQEIKAFRKATKNKIMYETDQDKFDAAVDSVDDSEKQAFIDASTERDINPEWWNIYKILQKEYRDQFPDYLSDCFEDIDELTAERNDIINTVKTGRFVQPALRDLSDPAWDRLKELDDLIEAAYEPIIDFLKNLSPADKRNMIPSAFRRIAFLKDVMDNTNPNKTLYNQLLQEARDQDATESLALGYTIHTNENEAISKYSRIVSSGGVQRRVPLSAFSYIIPSVFPDDVKQRFNVPDNFEYVKQLPKRFYNRLLESTNPKYTEGSLVNDDFLPEENTYLQPKQENPQYKILTDRKIVPQEVFDLYKLCLEIKSAADSLIPSISPQSAYKLPQMRGSDLAMLSRLFSRGPLKTINSVFTNNFVANETDDDIIDDFTTLPDGTRANNVPLKFIDNLKDMTQITSDVVGSLVVYYHMAANNFFKQQIAPLYQALLQQVGSDQYIKSDAGTQHLILGKTTNQYAKLKNVMDVLLYDQKQLWGERGSQSLKGSQRTGFKTLKFLAKIGTLAALSRNILSQTTGFFDASNKLHSFAFAGEAFNVKNIAFAISLFDSYLVSGRLFFATGEIIPHNLIAAIHQKNNLGTGLEYKYQGGYKSQARRMVGMERSGMGGFRVSDYAINSVLALAIYDNYRLLDNEFLPEISFKNKLKRLGYSRRQINKKYDKATTLLEAYGYDKWDSFFSIVQRMNKKFEMEPQYAKLIGEHELRKLEQNVQKAIQTWAPKLNGAVSDADKAVIQQNILAGFTVALRSYMLNEFQTRFAKGRDFQDPNLSDKKLSHLKKQRNALIKVYKDTESQNKKTTKLQELLKQKSEAENELHALLTSGDVKGIDWNYIKTTFGLGSLEGVIGGYVGSVFGIYGTIVGAAAGALHGGISAATNLRSKGKGNVSVFKSKISKLEERINEINAKIYALNISDERDLVMMEIINLNDQIVDILQKRNENQGFYDYARNIMTNGTNRLAGRALMNSMRTLYYYINLHMPRYFQTLKATYKPKITPLQIRGLKRSIADFVNISMIWLTTTYMLSWYRYDDGHAFLNGAFNEQTTQLMHKSDKILTDAVRPVMESETWKNSWEAIHESSTEGIINDISNIPLFTGFDKAVEQKADAMLGFDKKVSRKDKSVKRVKVDPVARQVQFLKAFGAVQALKVFTEQITPYDPQTINDLTNAASATLNVMSKELEASQQMVVDYRKGTLEDPMQGGPYMGYFNRFEYGSAHSWLRPFGYPASFEQTTEIGDVNRINFLQGTGLNKYLIPSKESVKDTKSKKKKGKKKRKKLGQ